MNNSTQLSQVDPNEAGHSDLDAAPVLRFEAPTAPTTGLVWFRANPAREGLDRVDREAHVLRGVALNTEGEAKGHGVHLDAEFVADVVKLGRAQKQGLKARFGHPAVSGGDALGTYLGRWQNFRLDKNAKGLAVARADLHFAESATKTPKGDLRDYVETLAEESADQFGTSIVFQAGQTYKRDGDGAKWFRRVRDNDYEFEVYYVDAKGKRHPDPEQLSAETFVEIKALHAADAVDQPAANPDGLFSAFTAGQLGAQVTAFLDEHPQVWDLLSQPEIASGFFARYEAHRKEHPAVKKNSTNADAPAALEAEAPATDNQDPAGETAPATPPAEPQSYSAEQVETRLAAQAAELATAHAAELTALSAKLTAAEAKAAALTAENAGYAKQFSELSGKLASLSPGLKHNPAAAAASESAGADGNAFLSKVQEIQDREQCSYNEARAKARDQYPQLFEAFLNAPKKHK